jgi:hypothetical protein
MIHQASTVILGTMNPPRPDFPIRNRPETPVAVAEYQDVRDVSGGTNPARRFWTRLPAALWPHSNSCAIVSPFISQANQAVSSPFGGVPGEHAKLWGGVGCWDEMDIEAGF